MTPSDLMAAAYAAFEEELTAPPPLTLRGGNDIDGYDRARPYDAGVDEPTDEYLERFAFWGIAHLDGRSWRHYLPRLMDYALRRPDDRAMVAEALVRSLRPPDRYPARLGSLTPEQERIVTGFLELLALDDAVPGLQEEAQQALEEWWLPNPRARPTVEELERLRRAPVEWRTAGHPPYRMELPVTLVGSGVRDIPTEARRVETFGGYVCGDVHTVVAVNVTPLSARSLADSVRARAGLFRDALPQALVVPGASAAHRLDGTMDGDSPAEPQHMTMILAVAGAELVTVSIRTWSRQDALRQVERMAKSLVVFPTESALR